MSDVGKQHVKHTVQTVEQVATTECNIPADTLHMGGPPVDNTAIDKAGEQSLLRLAAFAGGTGILISWWCLRSGRLIMMVFTVGILSAAASLAAVWFSGINMNAILLTMPALVYVAAVSGAIHMSNYYRDTAREQGQAGAPERAVIHAALPVCLATGTTAFGLATLCYSELVPIQLFGLYSAIGVVTSAVVLFLFLPSCFQFFPVDVRDAHTTLDAPALRDPFLSSRWRTVGEGVIRHHALVTAACVALMAVCGYGMTRLTTSVQLMRLFSGKAPILEDYKWLEQHLGELVPIDRKSVV